MKTKKDKTKFRQDDAWVSYISPFKLIVPDNEKPLEVTLEEINSNDYDHGKLCRIVGTLSSAELSHYKMVVCYDGALAIPRTEKFQKLENAVDFFNKMLCQLLLGGAFCEAVDKRDIVWGALHEKRILWPVNLGESASSHLHSKLRMRVASPIDTIVLSKPSFIKYGDFTKAINVGKSTLEKIYNLTPTYLIRGATEIKYRNWALALSSLWITIEQLTEYLWYERFIQNETLHPKAPIVGRIKALSEDHRTWSSSIKQEILYQSNIISQVLFQKLYPVRQARNGLVHKGKNVEQDIAVAAYESVVELLMLSSDNPQLPMKDINFPNNGLREETVGTKHDFVDWANL